MKLILFFCFAALLSACATLETPTPKPSPTATPSVQIKVLPRVAPTPSPAPVPSPAVSNVTLHDIRAMAAASACLKYNWKDRGHAAPGYIKGMAETMVRSMCRANKTMTGKLGDTKHDGLAWYGKGNSLPELYTLLTGLGMRESTGTYCEGYDSTAGLETADEAEAGLLQVSWNSHTASPDLTALMQQYQAHPENCKLDVFKEGADCPGRAEKEVGTGAGLTYQKFAKSCPAFAIEYGAILMRLQRTHWGPINRKEAEYRQDCLNLYNQVATAVGTNACGVLK